MEVIKVLVVCIISYDCCKGGSIIYVCLEDLMVVFCGMYMWECMWQILVEKGQVFCKWCMVIIVWCDVEMKLYSLQVDNLL